MILPVPKRTTDDEHDEPHAELLRRLLEYEKVKKGADTLDQKPWRERDFWRPLVTADIEGEQVLPQAEPEDLVRAWHALLHRASLNQDHAILRATRSVRHHISQILRYLRAR